MFVQPLIHRADIKVHIRVVFFHALYPLRGSNDTHKMDIPASSLLEHANRRRGGTARRKHRIHHENFPLAAIFGQFTVILYWL